MREEYVRAPWMVTAESYIGVKEIAGEENNPVIVRFFKESGFPEIKDENTAWCNAFVNAVMYQNGYEGTNSLLARSWVKWDRGSAPSTPRFGDIVVFSRGSDPTLGHVGFFTKWDDDWIYVLGGNQANSVNISKVSRDKLIAVRRPGETTGTPKIPRMSQSSRRLPEMTVEEIIVAGSGGVAAVGTAANGSPGLGFFLFIVLAAVAGFMLWRRS